MLERMSPMSGRIYKEDGSILNVADHLLIGPNRNIYNGLWFTAEKTTIDVANGSSVLVHIKAPTDKKVELTIFVSSTGKCYYKSYINSTYTNQGTPISMFNRKTNVITQPSVSILATPIINVKGAQRADTLINGSTGPQKLGGSFNDSMTLLMPGEDLLIEVISAAGNSTTNDICYTINVIERPLDYIG